MSDSGLINFNVTPSTNSMRLVARTPSDDTTETIEYEIVSDKVIPLNINTDKPLEYMVELTESFLYIGDKTIQSKMSGFLMRVSQSELKEEGKQQLKAWMEATGQLIGTLEGIKDATGKSVFSDTIEEVKQWMKKFEDSKLSKEVTLNESMKSKLMILRLPFPPGLGGFLNRNPLGAPKNNVLKISEDNFLKHSLFCFRTLVSKYNYVKNNGYRVEEKDSIFQFLSKKSLINELLCGLVNKGKNVQLMGHIDATWTL